MIANAQIQESNYEAIEQRSDGRQLAQEVCCLRAIIAELLIKNQHLRWELQRHPQRIVGS